MIDNDAIELQHLTEEEARNFLLEIELIEKELERRRIAAEPPSYGLPDITFQRNENQGYWCEIDCTIKRSKIKKGESEQEWKDRQDLSLIDLCDNHLRFLNSSGKRCKIRFIDKQFEFLSDFVFGRQKFAVLWGPRGGGKSLIVALIIWIRLVYYKQSIVDLAGSGEQAQAVYKYAVGFFDCVPQMKIDLLVSDPLKWRAHLKSNVNLYCCEKMSEAVGKHCPGFVADEACTGDKRKDKNLARAMQGLLSEKDIWAILLSTMHHSFGMFVDYWKNAKKYGYKKFKWDIFDLMKPCKVGLAENQTEKDPKALEYCKTKCMFSRYREIARPDGKGFDLIPYGCHGKARDSRGYLDFEDAVNAYNINHGGRIFWVEHACEDPDDTPEVFGDAMVERCVVKRSEITLYHSHRDSSDGIDWGMGQCFMVRIMPYFKDTKKLDEKGEIDKSRSNIGLCIVCSHAMSHQLEDVVIEVLDSWTMKTRVRATVYADSSHNYCNARIRRDGRVKVVPVSFKKYKDLAAKTLYEWMQSDSLRIIEEDNELLINQLKNLKKDPKTGKIVKSSGDDEKADHGADACISGIMHYPFMKWELHEKKEERYTESILI